MKRPAGYLCVVLHAHLPYVRHPEYPEFLEERWLFEAVRECYLPLIRVLQGCRNEPSRSRITLSLSPTLMSMLDDELLRSRCCRYLERVALLAARQTAGTAGDARWNPLARYYEALSELNLATWRACGGGDIIGAFLEAEKAGIVELITTAATHAFLPLWKRHPEVVRRQVRTGVRLFRDRTGHDPTGFWLPECGYYPGLESHLEDEGIRYFLLEAHGLLHARPKPPRGVHAPVFCPNGLAAFGRDPESSRQVWSSHGGYPGDPDYREYYRDIGTTMARDELRDVFPLADLDSGTGFKYHRITGPGEEKEPYQPDRAAEKALQHATDFLHRKTEQAHLAGLERDVPPVMVAPYDAELFGHWWFEGPLFLEALMNGAGRDAPIEMITPSDVLDRHPGGHEAIPAASTWGARGYHDVWLNDTTAWMYPHLFRAADRAAGLGAETASGLSSELHGRLLNQAWRELMLAQASDWPFMINAGSHVEYAEKRVRDHLARFYWLADAMAGGAPDPDRLEALETTDRLFSPEILTD